MDRLITINRHGVNAILEPVAPRQWRILIDEGKGAAIEHHGSRESAENRAGWECWCHRRRQ